MIIDAKENSVDHDSAHDYVFKSLRLNNLEALKSKAVDWLHRDDLWVRVNQQPLDLYPFLLLLCEVMSALSFFDLLVELVDNN